MYVSNDAFPQASIWELEFFLTALLVFVVFAATDDVRLCQPCCLLRSTASVVHSQHKLWLI